MTFLHFREFASQGHSWREIRAFRKCNKKHYNFNNLYLLTPFSGAEIIKFHRFYNVFATPPFRPKSVLPSLPSNYHKMLSVYCFFDGFDKSVNISKDQWHLSASTFSPLGGQIGWSSQMLWVYWFCIDFAKILKISKDQWHFCISESSLRKILPDVKSERSENAITTNIISTICTFWPPSAERSANRWRKYESPKYPRALPKWSI